MMNSTESLKECTAYFKDNPGFQRAFKAMKEKWRSYEAVRGTVKLASPSLQERNALGGFFSRVYGEDVISFRLVDFDAALQKTRFAGIHLEELLEAYFNEPLLSKRQEAEQKQNDRRDFFADIRRRVQEYSDPLITDWVEYLESGASARLLSSFDPASAHQAILNTAAALHLVHQLSDNETIPLSVLAMRSFGDPHALDTGTSMERLFVKGLLFLRQNEEDIQSAEEKLELYVDCGIRPDAISSFTVLQGIHLLSNGQPHPAYEGFLARREYALVSLSQLSTITEAVPVYDPVYIIENQMVYSRLAQEYPSRSLICTSGQLKTASLLVLDLLCRQNVRMLYCGDIDPEGLQIADKLITRSNGRIEPWHMSPDDYQICRSEKEISVHRLKELDHLKDPRLNETARELKRIGKAGYQEELIPLLLEDMRLAAPLA